MIPRSAALAILAAFLARSANAGTPIIQTDGKTTPASNCLPATLDWVTATTSYTGRSNFERGHDASGDSWENDIEIEHRFPINVFGDWPHVDCGRWYFRVGADYTRWDFGNRGGLPLPNHLQSIAGVFALEYVVNDDTAIMLETRPGVYFEQRVRSDSIDAPTILYLPLYHRVIGSWTVTAIGGVYASALTKYPVLPVAGIVMRSGKWLVRAVVPEPRIIYQLNDNLGIWAGAQLAGGGFSTDHRQYPGKPDLNGAVVTYEEYRAEAGITFKINPLTFDIGGGYTWERKFDYYRAERGYTTDGGAPFVKAQLRAAF